MSFEVELHDELQGFVGGRAFPDVAPLSTPRPYITYQQVGGSAWNYIEGAFPGKRHARMQINVWGDSREQVNALARQIEEALVESPMRFYVEGALVATTNTDVKPHLYGTRQDFSAAY